MKALESANQAVEERKSKVNGRYRPAFHPCAPEGWLNDPNGFSFFGGKVHLYYQHNPYDSVWGNIHWGQWTTTDFIHWQDEAEAIAPDMPYDKYGVFSGSGIVTDDKLTVMYTGAVSETGGDPCFQSQCIAQTSDGIHFTKFADNPVIPCTSQPEGHSAYDFRDPKIEKYGDGYRAIMASKDEKADCGQLVTYMSSDLHKWNFDRVYLQGDSGRLGAMTECPDFYNLGGKRVVTMCLISSPDGFRTAFLTGHEENGQFIPDSELQPLDFAQDFYAQQSMEMPDGRRIMIGWMSTSIGTYPTHLLHHGWAGMMSLPREMVMKNGILCQRPVREIENCRTNKSEFKFLADENLVPIPGCSGMHKEIDMQINMEYAASAEIQLMKTGSEYFSIKFDKHSSTLVCDRSMCGYPIADVNRAQKPFRDESGNDEVDLSKYAVGSVNKMKIETPNNMLHLQIFIDASIVEIFTGNGEKTISMLAFPKGEEYNAAVCTSRNAIVEGNAWDIE